MDFSYIFCDTFIRYERHNAIVYFYENSNRVDSTVFSWNIDKSLTHMIEFTNIYQIPQFNKLIRTNLRVVFQS